jgi:tRNA pseudouridine(55) synthase
MIFSNKEVGETPLELLDRIRKEKPELMNEKLSYAGRLDPMAEGQVLVLVGEENKERHKYLGLDKEYEVEFLVGIKTDTGDVLGIIEKINNVKQKEEEIKNIVENFVDIEEQKYPWFSSRTVNGRPLFEYYKEGNLDVERPVRKIQIKKAEFLSNNETKTEDIKQYIFDSIEKVKGDFRQKEILDKWDLFFETAPNELQTFRVKLLVSSGTYIRVLTESFDFPVCIIKLKRTKIFFK